MTRPARRLFAALASMALFVASAPAYYHFVHFKDDGGGRLRAVQKFDLAALTDKRVLFFVSRQRMPILAANDSFDGVLSQVRQALAVWDAVPTSALRVGFGGVVEDALPGAAPAGQIIFAELPPGVIGMGGPISTVDAGGFASILRSQVVIADNLVDGSRPRTSFSELFFSTLVHEIGHALGLQHTLASSAMSTDVTRSTTRPQPLGADDIAGLSVLYPTSSFSARTGVVTGRVTYFDGSPAALASVGAIHPGGAVVTALTDPDGAYRIEGLPPGDYLLYVQPLPPASQDGLGRANIVLPTEAGAPIAAGGAFRAVFRGGTDRPEHSARVAVRSGGVVEAIDFQVEPRPNAALFNVTTYSFPGNNAPGVHPAFLDLTARDGFLVATGQGLTAALPQLEIQAVDRDVQLGGASLYEPDTRFARIDLPRAPLAGTGPLHLLFRTPDDLYLLPGAVHITDRPAPVIHWVTQDVQTTEARWRVGGDGFDVASEVYFDGAPGHILDFDAATQEIVVVPPPGPPGRRAVVTVYNPDGQSSALTLPDGNAVFEYAFGAEPAFELSPAQAEADTDLLVEIRISGVQLDPPQLALGFGSSDIVVRDVQVLSPDMLRAVVTVRAGAAPGSYAVTLSNGLQTLVRPSAFEVVGPSFSGLARPHVRYGALVNSATGLPDLSPGALASLFGVYLSGGDPGKVTVSIGGQPARLLAVSDGQINLQIPEHLPLGVTELVVTNDYGSSRPMLIRLDRASPGLFFVLDASGSRTTAVNRGESASVLAAGLGFFAGNSQKSGPVTPIQIVIGGVRLTPTRIESYSIPGTWLIGFDVPPTPSPSSKVALLVDGRASNELDLSIR